jgi:hypothetical protein
MSWNVLAKSGLLCDKAAMFRVKIKETPCKGRSFLLSASLRKYKPRFLHARVDLLISQSDSRQ